MDMDRLEKLHQLMKSGAITKKEFEAEKNKIMKPAARSGLAGGTTPMDRLEKLHDLMQQGVISKEDFEEQKAKLISKKDYIESALVSDKKADSKYHDNCFDNVGEFASETYHNTRMIAFILLAVAIAFAVIDLGTIDIENDDYLIGMWMVGICVAIGLIAFDFSYIKKFSKKITDRLVPWMFGGLICLIYPVFGFFPAIGIWLWGREKALAVDYNNYQMNHRELSLGTAIPVWVGIIYGAFSCILVLMDIIASIESAV